MKMLFKQRFFSWLDSYDIFAEDGAVLYTVKGQLAWGHKLKIFDAQNTPLGSVEEVILTFLPKFEIYQNDHLVGTIKKEFTFFKPRFTIDYNGWQVEGDFWGWDYTITDASGGTVATISKEIFSWTDTYVIDVVNPADALHALMLVLAIDAEKCSSN